MGIRVILNYEDKPLKSLFKRAERNHAKFAVIIGEEEVKTEILQVKKYGNLKNKLALLTTKLLNILLMSLNKPITTIKDVDVSMITKKANVIVKSMNMNPVTAVIIMNTIIKMVNVNAMTINMNMMIKNVSAKNTQKKMKIVNVKMANTNANVKNITMMKMIKNIVPVVTPS